MIQNNIEKILKENPLIPVVTISDEVELVQIYEKLKSKNISVIEITLRTEFAWEAIKLFRQKYGDEFKVGVGTIINAEQIQKSIDLRVDFMVSPGLTTGMIQLLDFSGIPFITGVSTPSEIIRGIEIGWEFFKFFPADLFGGSEALKAYGSIFRNIKFCPTGGISEANYKEYLELDNVLAVGGSWLAK